MTLTYLHERNCPKNPICKVFTLNAESFALPSGQLFEYVFSKSLNVGCNFRKHSVLAAVQTIILAFNAFLLYQTGSAYKTMCTTRSSYFCTLKAILHGNLKSFYLNIIQNLVNDPIQKGKDVLGKFMRMF